MLNRRVIVFCMFWVVTMLPIQGQFDLQPLGGVSTNTSLPTQIEEAYEPKYNGDALPIPDTSHSTEDEEELAYSENGLADSGKPWEKLEGCRFMKDRYGDGDSFHVSHKGKEYIFRLYFVDAPESSDDKPFRVKSQAKYFGITEQQVLDYGHKATVFTDTVLQQPFTVHTQWLDAKGSSQLPRYFGVIITKDGKNLSKLLTEKALVRVYGAAADVPKVLKGNEFRLELNEIERKMQKSREGVWELSAKKF